MPSRGVILHLCADTGSDSAVWGDAGWEVIKVGADIGVENFSAKGLKVYGVIANPVCTDFSRARIGGKASDPEAGMFLVNECLRVIREANPVFWVLENPATGALRDFLGAPKYQYQPWWFGSPWTKRTGLWGEFNIPERKYYDWGSVPKNENLYIVPGRGKPGMDKMHKSAIEHIPEFHRFRPTVKSDAEFRSLCSQGFAKAFMEVNS